MAKYFTVIVISGFLFTLTVASVHTAGAEPASKNTITPEPAENWRADFLADPINMTLSNALTNNKVKEIAFNRQKWLEVGESFSNRIDIKGITDQQSSGRCLLFAGYNILRQRVREKYDMDEFGFSES